MEEDWKSTLYCERKSKLTALQKIMSYKEKTAGVVVKHGIPKGKTSYKSKKSNTENTTTMTSPAKMESSKKKSKRLSFKKHRKPVNKNISFSEKIRKRKESYSEKVATSTSADSSSPRRVLLHPSAIPPVSKLNSLVTTSTNISEPNSIVRHHKWSEGHMLWGKIRGYPFWPCMVSRDPFSKLFSRAVGPYKTSRTYHVQFFGVQTERSWIHEASLIEFEGREKFLDIVQNGLENPGKSSKPVSEFKISPAWYPAWSLAVAEADTAFKLTLEARVCRYTFQYMIVKGEECKPVDDLLKKIWLQSGSHLGANNEISDDDDNSLPNWVFSGKSERRWYDSDDVYSSDESSSNEVIPKRRPVKIAVRVGLLEVFLAKQVGFVQDEHPDWSRDEAVEYLKKQWSFMSSMQRNRYTSRHQKPVFVEVRKYRRHISETFDDVEDVDPDKLDLQIMKLSRRCHFAKPSGCCFVCEGQGSNLVCCSGPCGRYYHTSCIKNGQFTDFMCQECYSDACVCFACKKLDPDTIKCSQVKCQKYYHEICAGELKLTTMDKTGFICPLHTCATCVVEGSPGAMEGPFTECVQCPVGFHSSDFCIVAGSHILGEHRLMCASHFKPNKAQSQHARVNMKRCLECGNGDSLFLCQGCPAAYHEGCGVRTSNLSTIKQARLSNTVIYEPLKEGKEPWLCPGCLLGRKPLYGDIVWVKHGFYRWWPGEVCHPLLVPIRVQEKKHQVGEFPVRFFGSHDFAWVHQGRVISFDRVTKSCRDALMCTLDKVFIQGVKESLTAARICASVGSTKEESGPASKDTEDEVKITEAE